MQRRAFAFIVMLGLLLMFLPSAAWAQYQLRNLVSNQIKQAEHVDPLSVNGWGLARGATHPGGSRRTDQGGQRCITQVASSRDWKWKFRLLLVLGR